MAPRWHQPPEGDRVREYGEIERGEEPDREWPEYDVLDPPLYQGCVGCDLPRRAPEVALPDREKARLPPHGLEGDDGEAQEMKHSQPSRANEVPAQPGTQGDDEEPGDVEDDDEDVRRQYEFG